MYDLDCPFAEDYDFDGEFHLSSLCLIVRVCVPSVIGHIRLYTEQKWKRYTTIIYILWESIEQKVFTKA